MTGIKLFLLVNNLSDTCCFFISSFKSSQLKRCTNFERVSFLQSRRNQVEITSHAEALAEELSKKTDRTEHYISFARQFPVLLNLAQ